jgi:hypothetical protein
MNLKPWQAIALAVGIAFATGFIIVVLQGLFGA